MRITAEKVEEFRSLLKEVNVKEICGYLFEKGKIPRNRAEDVWESLRGARKDHTVLIAVVKEARRIKRKQERELATI